MELEEKLKKLAEHHIFGIRKLTRIGTSYGMIIPRPWILVNCVEVKGHYYFKLEVEGDKLIFTPLTLEDIDSINFKEKES